MKQRLILLLCFVLGMFCLTACVKTNVNSEISDNTVNSSIGLVLSQDEALKIVTTNANVNEVSKVTIKYEDDTNTYEIKFNSGGYNYNYKINAYTGNILESLKEYIDEDSSDSIIPTPDLNQSSEINQQSSSSQSISQSKPTEQNSSQVQLSKNYLSEEQIKTIVFNYSGLIEDMVTGLYITKDFDDGKEEFDVEFSCEGFEYSYDIDAISGEILNYEKDYEKGLITSESSLSNENIISFEKAIEIALNDLGVSKSDITGLNVDLDTDFPISQYKVEFVFNSYEYTYEINAETGEIIQIEKDFYD